MEVWKVVEWAPERRYALLRLVREVPGLPDLYLGCVEVNRAKVSACVNNLESPSIFGENYAVEQFDPIVAMSTVKFYRMLGAMPGKSTY